MLRVIAQNTQRQEVTALEKLQRIRKTTRYHTGWFFACITYADRAKALYSPELWIPRPPPPVAAGLCPASPPPMPRRKLEPA